MQTDDEYSPTSAQLVDVESSLWGIDKLSSDCDISRHPFCTPVGCLLTRDPRVAPHITPYACERGQIGDKCCHYYKYAHATKPWI